jgi:putative transposase
MEYRKGAYTACDLKYHIIWCTKYRYRVLTGEVANRVRELIREICAANYIEIVSGSLSPDHIHILISVPPNISLSKVMQYIKGKSSRKIMMEFENLRKRYRGKHIWARGYFAVTVGNLNEKQVQEYIENQEVHHKQDNFSITPHG